MLPLSRFCCIHELTHLPTHARGPIMSKRCAHCGKLKPESAFNWRNRSKGWKWGTCKTCQSAQRKQWYENNKERHKHNVKQNRRETVRQTRQFVLDYLQSHPCELCGESDPAVLEFHHRDPADKRTRVSAMINTGYSVDKVREEIEKCQVLCANCHRKVTSREQNWYKR